MDIYYLLRAICENISKEFPNHSIYIDEVTQGFKRPSFYVNLVTFNNEDLVKGELNKNVTFEIVYFAPIDERGQCNKLAQNVTYMALTNLFSSQALTVTRESNEDDVRIKITGISGGPRDNEVYMTIDFNYGFIQDVCSTKPEDIYYLMQELKLKYLIQ